MRAEPWRGPGARTRGLSWNGTHYQGTGKPVVLFHVTENGSSTHAHASACWDCADAHRRAKLRNIAEGWRHFQVHPPATPAWSKWVHEVNSGSIWRQFVPLNVFYQSNFSPLHWSLTAFVIEKPATQISAFRFCISSQYVEKQIFLKCSISMRNWSP